MVGIVVMMMVDVENDGDERRDDFTLTVRDKYYAGFQD
jgi:hypothetical protein